METSLPAGVKLSPKELKLYDYLIAAGGHPRTREEILRDVWGFADPNEKSQTVAVHMSMLRKKLGGRDTVINDGAGYYLPVREAQDNPAQ